MIKFFINIWNAQKNDEQAKRMKQSAMYWYERAVALGKERTYWYNKYKGIPEVNSTENEN
jgi:hypothetical protein